jgi:Fe-S-cluster containining protein
VSSPLRKELPIVEQIVPGTVCATCDVCCRFPERDSPLRPYFTRDEIRAAISAGVSEDVFADPAGSKISVVPDVEHGDGYRCPAFHPATGQCGIYDSRPLDCRLYPVAVMWDRGHTAVVAGWDSKCPFIVDRLDHLESHAYLARILAMLENQEVACTFVANPQLIGAFQEDVLILRPLERITQGLRAFSRGHHTPR